MRTWVPDIRQLLHYCFTLQAFVGIFICRYRTITRYYSIYIRVTIRVNNTALLSSANGCTGAGLGVLYPRNDMLITGAYRSDNNLAAVQF